MKDLFKNNCDIARDLLPMYSDSCTSEAATKALRTHLINCQSCRKYLSVIKKSKTNIYSTDVPDGKPDYSDLLKKIKHRKKIKHSLVWTLIVALVAGNVTLAISRKLNKND